LEQLESRFIDSLCFLVRFEDPTRMPYLILPLEKLPRHTLDNCTNARL